MPNPNMLALISTMLTKAVQEQQSEIVQLKHELSRLKKERN